jgi:hypothetical protein
MPDIIMALPANQKISPEVVAKYLFGWFGWVERWKEEK